MIAILKDLHVKLSPADKKKVPAKLKKFDAYDAVKSHNEDTLTNALRWSANDNAPYSYGMVYTFEDGSAAFWSVSAGTLVLADSTEELSSYFGY